MKLSKLYCSDDRVCLLLEGSDNELDTLGMRTSSEDECEQALEDRDPKKKVKSTVKRKVSGDTVTLTPKTRSPLQDIKQVRKILV